MAVIDADVGSCDTSRCGYAGGIVGGGVRAVLSARSGHRLLIGRGGVSQCCTEGGEVHVECLYGLCIRSHGAGAQAVSETLVWC